MENTFYLTLSQAAKEVGLSKATIFKYIKSGKLSYIEKTTAGYKIDPAELFRVFKRNDKIVTINGESKRLATPENDNETAFLRRENQLLREQLQRERENADHWRQQTTNLLTHQPRQNQLEPEVAMANPSKSQLWRKLFGRRDA